MKKNLPHPMIGASVSSGLDAIKEFQQLKLGNIILTNLPEDKNEALEVARYCRNNNISVMLGEIVHRHNHKRWHNDHISKSELEEIIAEAGNSFVGRYAIGEAGGMLYWPKSYTVNAGADCYENLPPCKNEAEAHKKYVNYLRDELEYERTQVCNVPLFNVESSIAFSYQSEAGIDGQCIEMLPGDPILTLSAIRGAAKAYNTTWGAHIAMLWYGGMRMDELWLKRWRCSIWTAYIFGADFIYPESGHFEYRVPEENQGAVESGKERQTRQTQWRDFHSPEMLATRRELRNLYKFTQIHSRPESYPESPAAVVQGNDDGQPGIWNPYAWGQYNNGDAWESSDAEKGWALFDTIFTRESLFHENVTGKHNYSGNPPGGQIDVIPPNADFSLYKTLLFIGYNRMDDQLYDKLVQYVSDGGHLFIWLSHFDNAERRGNPVKLFRNGDLSELCGIRVTGRGAGDVLEAKYIRQSTVAGYDFPKRSTSSDPYFIGRSEEALFTVSDREVRVLAGYSFCVHDNSETVAKRPLLIERKLGKGAVFTVTSFSKPGADGMRKFAESLVRTALRARRSELELLTGDAVRWAVYGSTGNKVVYAFNSDPDISSSIRLEYKGYAGGEIMMAPGEFRVIYVVDDLLFMPTDPMVEQGEHREGNYTFFLDEQELYVENPGETVKKITVNNSDVELAPHERKSIRCQANIPAAKKVYFSKTFLDEPEMVMKDLSTPY